MTDTQVLEEILEQARSVPVRDLPAFIGKLATANAVAFSRLQSPSPQPRQADELLNVTQAAQRLNVSKGFLYRHDFPFVRRMGKRLLYSAVGIEQYIKNRR
jgi:predicted DNA-binding transcriptional regulator AlpA